MKYSSYKYVELLEKESRKLKLGTVDPDGKMRANGDGRQCVVFYGSRREGMDAGKNVSKKGLELVIWILRVPFSFSFCGVAC